MFLKKIPGILKCPVLCLFQDPQQRQAPAAKNTGSAGTSSRSPTREEGNVLHLHAAFIWDAKLH